MNKKKMLVGLILSLLILNACDDAAPSAEEKKERVVQRFDVDGDGSLNEQERKTARQAIRKRRARNN